jgi:O-antigen/teichoic acid export membrane protein
MLKHSFYNVTAAGIRVGLGLLTVPLLIRLIGIEEYGLWTLAGAVIGVVALVEVGMSISTTVFVSRDLGRNDIEGISQTLTLCLLSMFLLATFAAFLMMAGAPAIMRLFPSVKPPQKEVGIWAVQVGGVVVWTRLLQQVLVGIEQAFQRFGMMNVLNVAQAIFTTVGMLLIAWFGGKVRELMLWNAVVGVGALLAHAAYVRSVVRNLAVHWAWNPSKIWEILRCSLMTWLIVLGGTLVTQADRIIVGALLGTTALGVYGAIANIAQQINSLSAIPVNPLLPLLSNLLSQTKDNLESLRKSVKQALQVNAVVAFALGATLLMLSSRVIRILFPGPAEPEYVQTLQMAVVITALYAVNATGYYILMALQSLKRLILIQSISGVLALSMIALGAKLMGLFGAVFGNVAYLTVWLFTFCAMEQLGVPRRTWAKWLIPPEIWYVSTIFMSLVVPYNDWLRLALVFFLDGLLLAWFWFEMDLDWGSVTRRISGRFSVPI